MDSCSLKRRWTEAQGGGSWPSALRQTSEPIPVPAAILPVTPCLGQAGRAGRSHPACCASQIKCPRPWDVHLPSTPPVCPTPSAGVFHQNFVAAMEMF